MGTSQPASGVVERALRVLLSFVPERGIESLRQTVLRVIRSLALIPAALFLWGGASTPIAWFATREPSPAFRVPYVLVIAIMLVAMIVLVSWLRGRTHETAGGPKWVVYFWPVVAATWLLYLAIALFAHLTLYLQNMGMVAVTSTDPSQPLSVSRLEDFFLWQFLAFIPLLDIPETLNWPAPATYSGSWLGFIILVYQAAVIIPIVLLFRHVRGRTKQEEQA